MHKESHQYIKLIGILRPVVECNSGARTGVATQIAVQVVNFETVQYLRDCILGLLAALDGARVPYTVTVLNNGSRDDLTGLAAEFRGRVAFHETPVNRGFGAGHNLLASMSTSPLLCFVNPDIVVSRPDAFTGLLAAFEHPRVAAAGPLLLTERGAPQRWDHGELRGIRARIANGAGYAHWAPQRDPIDAAWVSGAFMIVRRDAFERAGGFDEDYFLYKEDEDLCLALRRAGFRVRYDPRNAVTHIGSVVARRDSRHLAQANAHFTAKHYGRWWNRKVLAWIYLNISRRV